MVFTETQLPGSYIIEIEPINDTRGFFARAFCEKEFQSNGLDFKIVQSNVSYNERKGNLRGMHFQNHPFEEIKIVRCTKGAIFDVIIDLREKSPTFMQWTSVELTQNNRKMIYVPNGFAHGYLTLKDKSEIFYHVSQFYSPEHEAGIRWNDPAFNIIWPEKVKIISEKDAYYQDFKKENG